MHILNVMRSMPSAYECAHGERGVDCDFMMVLVGALVYCNPCSDVLVRMKCQNVCRVSTVIRSLAQRNERENA